ncbi:SH3 domain-binding protein 5 isoform X1 [Microplitis demolitor]|uniref:SH3 domain-binding protein 5 isoform X1 n=1 Tax=Microplitis demolitor TaxID=69319 RepID=UPI0004CCCEA5|nr:SH3 domain-binding protein 5 isoform X1 [Microplitis demolitor]
MSERNLTESANDDDKVDDAVDPRVQIELERLNTATDNINKLEVDLDEARATFRELLCESTMTIDNLSKKLGTCIEKSRPYYDARFKAKEALRDAQKAAIRFERANGQHAAAKEMVYLAEEGLRMEGRCFDHAWQEMLNHATERVNESEHERAISEAEHRHMTALYHNAEHTVQRLQSELKRSVTKSSLGARRSLLLINSITYQHNLLLLPYYEMKAQFHQALEKQKLRVSELERSVGEAKMTYAEALRNLEKISDEIHRTRQYDSADSKEKNSKHSNTKKNPESSSESSITGSPDSTDYTSDEYLRLPDKISPTSSISTKVQDTTEYLGLSNLNLASTEPRKYIKRKRPQSIASLSTIRNTQLPQKTSVSTSRLSELITSPSLSVTASSSSSNSAQTGSNELKSSKSSENKFNHDNNHLDKHTNSKSNDNTENNEKWTEISLNNSPDDIYYNNDVYSDDDDQIPYKPLPSELSPESIIAGENKDPAYISKKRLSHQQSLPATVQNNEMTIEDQKKSEITRSPSTKCRGRLDSSLTNWITRNSAAYGESSCAPGNAARRQSLDMLWNTGTGERMKELLNHGMMMLNISSLTERRSSEPKLADKDDKLVQKNDSKIAELKGKKVPSPLEKTMSYLNPDEETSDSESLASVEMLSEDQISSLMMEPDINQVCQEVLGTPLVEVCPLLQQLQEQQ